MSLTRRAVAAGRHREAGALVLLVVADVVLERLHRVPGLHAAHLGGHRVAGQERVLAEVLGLAARERRAVDVHRRPGPQVEALAAQLGGDRAAIGAREPPAERRGERLRRRPRGRAVGAHAARPVGEDDRRHAQARRRAEVVEREVDLLVEAQRRQQLVRARERGLARVAPRLVGRARAGCHGRAQRRRREQGPCSLDHQVLPRLVGGGNASEFFKPMTYFRRVSGHIQI